MSILQTASDFVETIDSDEIWWSDGGVECKFVPINSVGLYDIGLKLYQSEEERDGAYLKQMLAADADAGPEAYGEINIPHETHWRYGYVTEVVKTVRDTDYSDLIDGWDGSYWDKMQDEDTLPIALQELKEKMRKAGITWHDHHMGNVGIKNRYFVCIDFGIRGNR